MTVNNAQDGDAEKEAEAASLTALAVAVDGVGLEFEGQVNSEGGERHQQEAVRFPAPVLRLPRCARSQRRRAAPCPEGEGTKTARQNPIIM